MIQTVSERARSIETSKADVDFGWIPVIALPAAVLACRDLLNPWVFMWCLAFAIFAGLKWLTWWKARGRMPHSTWRSVAYLLAWPGMDAEAFLNPGAPPKMPTRRAWTWALLKTASGVCLIWIVARLVPAQRPLVRGWVGMLGLILLLHFGSFEIIALFWQSRRVNAKPIMSAPLRATSLAEFWGKRWNLGFRQVSHDVIFRPLRKRLSADAASLVVFAASGLIHELVISVPARGGYGLPTAYFLQQGLGVALERSWLGQRLGLRKGPRGWLFTVAFTAGPICLLFHRPFVLRVILPFLEAVRAI